MNILTILGDIYLDRSYIVRGLDSPFIVNLEHPITKRGKPIPNKTNLQQERSYLLETFGGYPIAVCLANNHIFDYGDDGFQDTISYLSSNGVGYYGAGNPANNYYNPFVVELKGRRLGLFGYVCPTTHPVFCNEKGSGVARIDLEKILLDMKAHRDALDLIIISLHWGEEEVPFPRPEDISLARQLIDHGADIIVGHHAHIIQSYELYKNKHIFYGLGNFLFPDLDTPCCHDGAHFTSRYEKRWFAENNQSIAVCVDEDLSVSYRRVLRKGETCTMSTTQEIKPWGPLFSEDHAYFQAKKTARTWRKIQHYIKSPIYSISRKIKYGRSRS